MDVTANNAIMEIQNINDKLKIFMLEFFPPLYENSVKCS